MPGNASLSRKQERFLQALLLGESITGACKSAGINESTGHRWLKDPLVQEIKQRREEELRKAEEAEIERIMTTGYAATHERVKALDSVARLIEQSWHTPPDPEDPGSKSEVAFQWLTPDKIREWRGCLDDIASETGGRVKQVKKEVTSPDVAGAADLLFNKLAAFQQKKLDEQSQS